MNVVMLTTVRAARANKAQAEHEAASASLLARVEALELERWRLHLEACVLRAQAASLNSRHRGTAVQALSAGARA